MLDSSQIAITNKHRKQFQSYIHQFYQTYGRDLPWRHTSDPYTILVSELMLQQTQVDRVIPKYTQWLNTFPTFKALAAAPFHQVLSHWKGLGYNRRAQYLHRTAQKVSKLHQGELPKELAALQQLPGIGPYTAAAIRVFAFNQPERIIETNIRSVYLYHFFPNLQNISDAQLKPYIKLTYDTTNPRDWVNALMDYGAYLKTVIKNPSQQSAHHTTQSTFKGSNRQLRGQILERLLKKPHTLQSLSAALDFSSHQIKTSLLKLQKEKLIDKHHQTYRIPGN